MNIKPLNDKVYVMPDQPADKTSGGLSLLEDQKGVSAKGTVAAAGPGVDGKPLTVKAEDKILFFAGSGVEVVHEGVKYFLMSENDILGIL